MEKVGVAVVGCGSISVMHPDCVTARVMYEVGDYSVRRITG